MPLELNDPVAVGRNGRAFLLIERGDAEALNLEADGQVHFLDEGGRYGDVLPIQRIFKFLPMGEASQEEYESALMAAGIVQDGDESNET